MRGGLQVRHGAAARAGVHHAAAREQHEAVEAEIESIRSRLKGEGIGDRTPLVDAEGFPHAVWA